MIFELMAIVLIHSVDDTYFVSCRFNQGIVLAGRYLDGAKAYHDIHVLERQFPKASFTVYDDNKKYGWPEPIYEPTGNE